MSVERSGNINRNPIPAPQSGEKPQLELEAPIYDKRVFEEFSKQASDSMDRIKQLTSNTQVEQARDERRDDSRREDRVRTDSASISEESKLHELTPEELLKLLKAWTLENEKIKWEEFLKWIPSSAHTLSQELKKLTILYQQLLEAVIRNTFGKEQAVQLERLDQALSTVLNRLCDSGMKDLMSFIVKFGSEESVLLLKKSIHASVTGQVLPTKALERFWAKAQASSAANSASAGHVTAAGPQTMTHLYKSNPILGGSPTAGKLKGTAVEQGIIYQEGAKGRVTADQQYHNNVQKDRAKMERVQSGSIISNGKGLLSFSENAKGASSSIMLQGNGIYSSSDLTKSENFVRYLENQGNLFLNEKISGGSEELLGVLASAMSLKSQVFTSNSGISMPMKITIQSAVDKFVDYCLFQTDHTRMNVKRQIPLSQKAVYKIYYYMMQSYGASEDPQYAISDGIKYALEIFKRKKMDSNYQQDSRYMDDTGFFREEIRASNIGEKNYVFAELKYGKKILDNDWKEFIRSMEGECGSKIPIGMMQQSPWGQLVNPEKGSIKRMSKHFFIIFLAALGVALLTTFILWLV